MRYFDTSTLTKRYVREKDNLKIHQLLSSNLATTNQYSTIKIASTLTQRTRKKTISHTDRKHTLTTLQTDLSAMLIVELTAEVIDRTHTLLQRHFLQTRDALHLASYLCLQKT